MRVLHLSSSFPRRAGDVSGLFVLDLARTLVAAGVEVHVVAPHDAGAAADEVLEGVRVHRFRYAPEAAEVLAHRGGLLKAVRSPSRLPLVPAFLLAFWWSARRAVRRLRPDVVHAHWWFPGGLVAALLRAPFVVTLHGSDVHLAAGPLRPLARWVLRRAAVVGVVSEALGREVAETLGIDAVLLRMPLVVDGQPTPIPPPPVRVVAVGRHAEEKGFDVLLAALAGTGIELELFGEGTEALGGHGPAPRSTIADALGRAHALVVPSRREGLGLVAVEAMALGRPVIASAVGGLVESVGEDGLLVPAGDVDALRAALLQLPLPVPAGAAVARHRPEAVAAAHVEAYLSARRR